MTFSRHGAIDLSVLKQPAPGTSPAPGGAAAGSGASYVIDVSDQEFEDVVKSSMEHIVVLGLWSPRSTQSQSFNQLLATVVSTYQGKMLLAQVDVDANPGVAQALQVQGVPAVFGLVQGQPVPLFQGTAEEPQIRQVFDELVTLAGQHGITGLAQPAGGATAVAEPQEQEEPPEDPRFAEADIAFAAGDLDLAIAEYEKVQAQYPADGEVTERLAGIRLMSRTRDADLQSARDAAALAPEDVDAQLLVADLDVSGGHIEDAFDRLIQLVKRLPSDEREGVRERLIELFTIVGASDPRVATARRALAKALF
jgi:putative thioredoxin